MLKNDGARKTQKERVGHKALQTTFGYMKTTKAAREAVARAFDEEKP